MTPEVIQPERQGRWEEFLASLSPDELAAMNTSLVNAYLLRFTVAMEFLQKEEGDRLSHRVTEQAEEVARLTAQYTGLPDQPTASPDAAAQTFEQLRTGKDKLKQTEGQLAISRDLQTINYPQLRAAIMGLPPTPLPREAEAVLEASEQRDIVEFGQVLAQVMRLVIQLPETPPPRLSLPAAPAPVIEVEVTPVTLLEEASITPTKLEVQPAFTSWRQVLGLPEEPDSKTLEPYRKAMGKLIKTHSGFFQGFFVGVPDQHLAAISVLPALTASDLRQAFPTARSTPSLAHVLELAYRANLPGAPLSCSPEQLQDLARAIQKGKYQDWHGTISDLLGQYLAALEQPDQSATPEFTTPLKETVAPPEHFPRTDAEVRQFILDARGIIQQRATDRDFSLPSPLVLNDRQITHVLGGRYSARWMDRIRGTYPLHTWGEAKGSRVPEYDELGLIRLIALRTYEGKHIDDRVLMGGFKRVFSAILAQKR